MTSPLKARPTTYKGIPMRSRLEASFAACLDRAFAALPHAFDPAGWQYEPVCFADESGQYLPDFAYRLLDPDGRWRQVYIEVKPVVVDDDHWSAITQRMAIVWGSEPDALLQLCEFDGRRRHWHGVNCAHPTEEPRPWWSLTSAEEGR